VSELEYRVLGPLEVQDGDRSLPLAGANSARCSRCSWSTRTGLSPAIADGRAVGQAPAGTGGSGLQVYVSRLRKLLPPGALLTRPPGYLLELEPEELDLHRFKQLLVEGRRALANGEPERAAGAMQAALALWRGPALVEFAFESFAHAEIGRWTVDERIEADLVLARHAEVIGELEALIAENPHRKRPRGQADACALPLGSTSRGAPGLPRRPLRARR
jgi:Bacterial transcriptional activator domain